MGGWLQRNPRTGALIGFAALALLAWAVVGETHRASEMRAQATEWENHTLQVQLRTQLLLNAVEAAETGQRGYLLTGDDAYLAPYTEGVAVAQGHMDELQRLTADNVGQQALLSEVERLMQQRLRLLQEIVGLAEVNRPAAIARLRQGQGKAVMDALRARIDEVWAEEGRLLAARRLATEAAREQERRAALLLVLTALALIGALALATLSAVRLARETRRQAQHVEVAERVKAELEVQVTEALAAQRRSEAALQQAQKMEAVGQLAGGIAHDFNNMLAVVIGSLEIAERRLAAGEADISRHLGNAMDGARRASALTHRILAFSRRQPLAPGVVNINRLVSDMAELLHRTLGADVKLETVLASGLWKTKVDSHQLENVVLNLAVNARDAMPGGGALTIETANAYLDDAYAAQHEEVVPGQYVALAVTDTGVGMTAEVVARAFEPFFTTKESGKGTGLGLSQAIGFVKQSGGHIKMYSEVGQGTSVKVYLPRWTESGVIEPGDAAEALAAGENAEEIVLVVEDDERVRQISVEALRELGYTVRHAGGGAEALRLLESNPRVHLLFTDIVMPDMNGRELAGEVRKRWPHIKVLYTTGYTRNAIVHNGVLDAGVAFIAKPFSLEQLGKKVRDALDA